MTPRPFSSWRDLVIVRRGENGRVMTLPGRKLLANRLKTSGEQEKIVPGERERETTLQASRVDLG